MKYFIFSIFLLLLFSGCSNNQTMPVRTSSAPVAEKPLPPDLSPSCGDTIIDSSIADAVVLNPILYTDSPSGGIIGLVFSGLTKIDSNRNITGDLAQTWEISSDGLEIIFHLKKEVLWHDMEKFTADDVLFTYQAIMDPATVTADRGSFKMISTVEAVDQHTVRVVYKEPFAPALSRWSIGILPEHLYRNDDINKSRYNKNPIGTGPFRFVEWTPDERIVLEAFDRYFDGRPYINRYICNVIPDSSMAFLALKRNEIDIMSLSMDQYIKQANTESFLSRFNVYRYPSVSSYTYIGYNHNKEKFRDQRVRQALTLAVNRQEIVSEVLYGYGKLVTGPFAPGEWACDSSILPFSFSPEKARSLLNEAGWTDTDGDGFIDRNGENFVIELATNNGNEIRKLTAGLVQQYWKSVGIKAELKFVEWTVFMKMCDYMDFDALILSWGLGTDPDRYGIWHSSQIPDMENGKTGNNFIGYRNEVTDMLWERGRKTFDLEERKKIYHKIHAIIHEDQPYTFLFMADSIFAIDKRIHGINIAPSGIFYNFEKWWVPRSMQRY